MSSDFEDHFDEELGIIEDSLFGGQSGDKLDLLYRRAYYCSSAKRDDKFRPELCPSTEELEWVVSELNQSTDRRRSARLIKILKYATEDWMLPSLAKFLDGPSPGLASEVLEIFRDIDAAAEYADQIISIMRGLPWDELQWCQRGAMECIEEYLRSHSNPRLLRELLNIYESEEFEANIREEAMRSLERVVGIEDLSRETVLLTVKARLADEER